MLQNDRQILISAAGSRKARRWPAQTLWWSELCGRLATPSRGTETVEEYLRLPKSQQDELKDVGGFVAGALIGERRKAACVAGRDVVTLDLDRIAPGGTDEALRRVDMLGCGWAVYSTRKHRPDAPRLRALIPLARTVSAEEYEAIARKLAEHIGMDLCDPTTFEASRLMYWPSCCADGEYVYYVGDKGIASPDGILAMYENWRDVSSWPQVPGTQNAYARHAAKQGDPTEKSGVVGAFCRVYDIPAAMEKFLPGIYEPCDIGEDRFTFTGGSTAGGVVVYDGGRFLYSHHSTDPCGGKLVNAFDMVRLHRFEDGDDDVKDGTPVNRLPSYIAMCELAASDSDVSTLMARERIEEAQKDFSMIVSNNEPGSDDAGAWVSQLTVNKQTGQIKNTIDNVWLILENDPNLKGKFALNEFAGRGEVLGSLPWAQANKRRLWDDNDSHGLYWYLEKYYFLTGNGKIDAALSLHSAKHSFNDVQDYLHGLQWDGGSRLDTLFIDFLGAEDTPYTRAVTRKAFTAAVARAMDPGCKFDCMTLLLGEQGAGKSTLLDKMSRGWFNDSIRSFEGKEASELLQGVWLVELSEYDRFNRTDVARIKQFLSLRADRFRAAYGRHVKELPRCCVFFGTANPHDILTDKTGNRRYWPVDICVTMTRQQTAERVCTELDAIIDQLWAEAVTRWRGEEPLYLDVGLESAARQVQEGHRETSAREGLILDFVEREVPVDWAKWPLVRRNIYWSGGMAVDEQTAHRERICALEVWCEALGGDFKGMHYNDAAEINAVLAAIPGWERTKNGARFGYCGLQKGFVRAVT